MTVILAAGDFPKRGGEAWRILSNAQRVVACDSAADAYRRRFHRWPTVIIGDLDSLSCKAKNCKATVVHVDDQDTNDLEKAIAHCKRRGWKTPVVVGAIGKREDHAIGNIFRALEHGLEIVTDHGCFVPVLGRKVFHVKQGAAMSVFAPDPKTRMTSRGLEWSLDNVRFRNLYCATLNRAIAATVTITSTHPAYVYL